MKLHTIKSTNKKNRKRVGRGNASNGTYSGRGMNGQNARSGGKRRPGFEGGQTPFIQRLPKLRGFKSHSRINYQVINLNHLEERFEDGAKVDLKALKEKNLIKNLNQKVKILGNGELKKKLEITAHSASKAAEEKIKKAGSKLNLI